MPIQPHNRARYPPTWPAIRARLLERARHRCEQCGKRNRTPYVVTWDGSGRYLDDYLPPDATAPAPEWAGVWRDRTGAPCPPPGPGARYHDTQCVLTVAHLNHQPEDCRDENLLALCQACHLHHDQAHHAQSRHITRRTRQERAGQQTLQHADDC